MMVKASSPDYNQQVFYHGKQWNLSDLARRYNIPPAVLHKRIFVLGWRVAKAVTTRIRKYDGKPNRGARMYRYQHRNWSLYELAAAHNLAYSTLYNRIVHQGMSVTQAVTTPVNKNKSRARTKDAPNDSINCQCPADTE